jgi:ADP-ribose pyrophosphatase
MAQKLWKVVGRELLFTTSRGIEVAVEQVELPDGRRVDDYLKLVKRSAAIIACETRSGDFVVLRQYQHGPGEIGLTFPGGLIEDGEAPLAAAQRELLEETGYTSTEWQLIGSFARDPNQGYGAEYYFLARASTQLQAKNSLDLEESELILMPKSELRTALLRGEVRSVPDAFAFAIALLS